MSEAETLPTQAPESAPSKGDEEDLTYDEYDLSKECHMLVTCISCDTKFTSLEKFILHKKSQCRSRNSDSLPAASGQPKTTTPDKTSTTGQKASTPWIFESLDFEESDEARVGQKRKEPEQEPLEIEEPATLTKRMSKVYSRSKNGKASSTSTPSTSPQAAAVTAAALSLESSTSSIDTNDRRRATTIPDEVKRISIGAPEPQAKRARSDFFDSESEDEEDVDIQKLITVNVSQPTPESDDSDAELPVEVTPNHSAVTSVESAQPSTKPRPIAPAPLKKGLIPYRLVKVEEVDKKGASHPSLGLTLVDLKHVKVLNLLQPLPAPFNEGFSVYENMADGSLLEGEQTVLATTKEGRSVKLGLRRVVKHPVTSKLMASSIRVVEQIKDVTESSLASPAAAVPTAAGEAGSAGLKIESAGSDTNVGEGENASSETALKVGDALSGEEGSVVQTDDDTVVSGTVFEHDPDLYDFLKDDEHYTLGPKVRHRLSRLEIKNSKDCDWLTRRCLRCNTLYSCLKTLINHMNYQHADRKSFFPCIYCRNIYSQQKNLSRHMQKTHNKSKDFVDRLRPFVRNQAFIRQLKNLETDSEKLTEENDPFLRNLRRRIPPATPTKFCSISDTDMLVRYGRKVQNVGRPPGRPSKARSSNVSLTCTMCLTSINSYREMLRHFKDVHEYSQKRVNKLKRKMVERINDVTIKERQKALAKSHTKSNGVAVSKVDPHGRLIVKQDPAAAAKNVLASHSIVASKILNVPVVSPVTPRPQQQAKPVVSRVHKEPVLQLVQCQTCSKVFNGTDALMRHACSPERGQSAASQSAVSVQNIAPTAGTQLIAQPELSVNKLMDSVGEEGDRTTLMVDPSGSSINFIQAPLGTDNSGLETLAMISTNEAQKAGSPKSVGGEEVAVEVPMEVPVEVPISAEMIAEGQVDGDSLQTLSITLEQLEQLKAGGGNIIYVVKTSSGDMERIDDPQGMEVVEISHLAEQGATFM